MPRELSAEAKAEWRWVVAVLEEIGALHTVDRSFLIRYCSAWAEWVELDALVAKSGRLVRGQKGNLVRNPLWLMRRDAGQALNELGAQLGISPTARLRNGVRHEWPEPDTAPDLTAIEEYRRMLEQ
jgi:P27 family predicted phage terminase small subunit